MTTLKFQTGRGGRFNNSGYVTFVDFEEMTENSLTNFFPNVDEDGEEIKDQDGYVTYFKESGNELDYELNEDGTGYINEDEDYDTTTWVKEDDLTDKQIFALIRAKEDHWNTDEVERILNEHYQDYL